MKEENQVYPLFRLHFKSAAAAVAAATAASLPSGGEAAAAKAPASPTLASHSNPTAQNGAPESAPKNYEEVAAWLESIGIPIAVQLLQDQDLDGAGINSSSDDIDGLIEALNITKFGQKSKLRRALSPR